MLESLEKKLFALVHLTDDSVEQVPLNFCRDGKALIVSFPEQGDWSGIQSIDFAPELGKAAAGNEGYYVIPHGQYALGDSVLCRFRERDNAEMVNSGFVMPIWGAIGEDGGFTAIVSSMTYDYQLVTSVTEGIYRCFARFELKGEAPYEPIIIEYQLLDQGADYNDVALSYRHWRENRGEIHPYAKRMENRPALAYTAESIYVRIRQGWKPVPSPVPEQTPETEPPMHVAATFEDVSRLLDEFREKGIDKAEFCLVGWNKSGHDGRWPQIFPVEEKLGGEAALRELTAKAKAMNYAMVCHTNSTDAYSIADIWGSTELIQNREGQPEKNDKGWSGGDMYHICPHCGLEQARQLLPKVKEMGFAGTHYIDVITTVFPRACYDPKHPATRRDCVEKWNRILRFSRDLFGGISSEGCYDFAAPELDYGLYVSFGLKESPLADECVPLWQLIYHGYVLSNPYTKTVNPVGKDLLKLLEYGGRPSFYYDSKFVTPKPDRNVNWMGEDDFHCHTEEDRQSSAEYIAKVSRWYEKVKYLQLIPMKRHEALPEGKKKVVYENGDEVLVDYENGTAFLNGERILPLE